MESDNKPQEGNKPQEDKSVSLKDLAETGYLLIEQEEGKKDGFLKGIKEEGGSILNEDYLEGIIKFYRNLYGLVKCALFFKDQKSEESASAYRTIVKDLRPLLKEITPEGGLTRITKAMNKTVYHLKRFNSAVEKDVILLPDIRRYIEEKKPHFVEMQVPIHKKVHNNLKIKSGYSVAKKLRHYNLLKGVDINGKSVSGEKTYVGLLENLNQNIEEVNNLKDNLVKIMDQVRDTPDRNNLGELEKNILLKEFKRDEIEDEEVKTQGDFNDYLIELASYYVSDVEYRKYEELVKEVKSLYAKVKKLLPSGASVKSLPGNTYKIEGLVDGVNSQ